MTSVGSQARRPVAPRHALAHGSLPTWGPWAVAIVGIVTVVALLPVTEIAVGLLLVGALMLSVSVVYLWSRAIEGPRRATDRSVTFAVSSAFVLALTPLASLLYTVVAKGPARLDVPFFTESARNVVGEGGGASHAIVGTLVITGVATLASVPIGVLAAI